MTSPAVLSGNGIWTPSFEIERQVPLPELRVDLLMISVRRDKRHEENNG